MKHQTLSTAAPTHSPCLRPEFRGNLFLGLLLGIHLLISLPTTAGCAYAQAPSSETVSIQTQNRCS